jgi:hypothetical protein
VIFAGLDTLTSLHLYLPDPKGTKAGLAELRSALPWCEIEMHD